MLRSDPCVLPNADDRSRDNESTGKAEAIIPESIAALGKQIKEGALQAALGGLLEERNRQQPRSGSGQRLL
jgi:hypothetical protein